MALRLAPSKLRRTGPERVTYVNRTTVTGTSRLLVMSRILPGITAQVPPEYPSALRAVALGQKKLPLHRARGRSPMSPRKQANRVQYAATCIVPVVPDASGVVQKTW